MPVVSRFNKTELLDAAFWAGTCQKHDITHYILVMAADVSEHGTWYNPKHPEGTVALLTFRVLHRSAPPYLGPLVPVHSLPHRQSLRSTGTNRLLVPPVKRSTIGSRAYPVAGPKTWNALPEDVTSSQSEYTFRHQLKTWLFKKSFPDIIIWYWLHLNF